MKKLKTAGISILVAACAACLSLAFVACSGGEKNANYGVGEEGFYYYDGANSARYMLSLQSGTYMITAGGETQYSGSYSYDEGMGVVSFTGDASFTATMGESALSLDMGDSGYSFKAYRYFDVTYVDENGKVVATESVLNGQSAEAIAVDKDGYWFAGWFEDSNNSSEFAFNTSIAGDTTVYGWYIEKNLTATEYEITLDYGDGTTEKVSTMNGAVWTLPTDGILGWWVSATNNSGELSYKYETGTAFTSDTTLFAVYEGIGASVTGEGITWVNAGANVSVIIYNGDGTVAIAQSSTSSSNNSYAPSGFTSLPSGTYIVEVTSGTTTEQLTYVVNGLPRVSISSYSIVVNGDGRVLTFAPVENASGYTITIDDGEKVVTEDLGSRTYYNLSSWEMTGTGLNITITAYADGYVSSVSDEYNYLLKLDSVVIEMSGDDFSWNRVEGALEYEVIIYGEDDEVLESFYTTDTSYSLKYYGVGMYTISVKPVTGGYWSTETFIHGQAKYTIAAPVITDITDYTISWTKIEEAESYVVMINGETYEVTEGTTLAFSKYNVPETASSYEIAVMAIAEEGLDSSYSDTVTATNKTFSSSVTYEKNTVTWNYDVSATSYIVSVNGTDTTIENGNNAEITLSKAGNNEITVTAYSGTTVLGQAEVDVYAYAVILDPNGAAFEDGTSTSNTIYVAQGDTLNLGEVEKDHADFIGWYTQADYTDGQSDVYEGKGSEVVSGSVFTGSRDMYVYAYWSYEYTDVSLYVGEEIYGNMEIKYNSKSFSLPVVEATLATEGFAGWYSEEDIRYTAESGLAVGVAYGGETALYARFLTLFDYRQTRYDGETVYAVSAGSEINEVSSVTVPETYEGYMLVLNTGAFENCANLVTINIPDTVLYIAITNDGYRSGTGAFAGCSSLTGVNVYSTGINSEPQYFSDAGVLFRKIADSEKGDVEIAYYPYAKSDSAYVIPATVSNDSELAYDGTPVTHDVTRIPTQVFRERAVSVITIPSTVTEIDSQAFYNMAKLTEVIFADGGDAALTIEDGAFRYCTSIKRITLPARYGDFNANAFSDCTALTAVYVEAGGTYSSTSDGILLTSDGLTLVYFPIGLSGEIVISDYGATISKIGDSAFANNTKITSVTISETVTEIGESAFEGCRNVETLTFLGNLNSKDLTIKSRAFYGCTKLRSVSLPENLVTTEENAFGGCIALTDVYFNGGAGRNLSLATGSFGSVSYVTSLTLGASVPQIDIAGIFGSNITAVTIEAGSDAYYSDEYGVVYNKAQTSVLYYPASRTGAYELLSTTTDISANVFAGHEGLTQITIGAGVNTIADGAFAGCTNLSSIIVAEGNSNYGNSYSDGVSDGILYKEENGGITELLFCPLATETTELTVASSVVKVAGYAFTGNTGIKSVEFETEASFELGEYAFYECTSLESVVLPDCMTTVPAFAFYGCTSLETVHMSEGVTEIKESAFSGCTSLVGDISNAETGLTLPEGLVTIGDSAFYGDNALAVTIPSTVETIGDSAFYRCWYNNATGTKVAIKFAEPGDDEDDKDASSAATLTIGKNAFYETRYATALNIPARTVSIGESAFENYANKQNGKATLTFDEGCALEEIGERVFASSGFAALTLPASVKKIGESAFDDSYVESISFAPEGGESQLEEIGVSAFSTNCLDAELVIPAGVKVIGDKAFYSNSDLPSLTFEEGSSLTTIGEQAFYKCGTSKNCGFEELKIPESVTEIGYGAFDGCKYLVTVSFEEEGKTSALKVLNYATFESCTALESVTLPSGLEELGTMNANSSYGVFYKCTSLEEIDIPATVKLIGTRAFYGCSALETVNFAQSGCALEEIQLYAFYGTGLKIFAFPESTAGSITLGEEILGDCELESLTLSSSITDVGLGLGGMTTTSLTIAEGNTSYTADESGSPVLYSTDETNGKTLVVAYGELEGELEIPEGVVNIGDAAFYMQSEITCVKIPASVESIGSYAFQYCSNLAKVEIAEDSQLTTLGEYAFSYCTSLSDINLPNTVTSLPEGCLESTSLSSATLPNTITYIGVYALYGSGIKTVNLSNVSYVGQSAFTSSSVETVVLPGVTSIGTNAFEACKSLKSVTINGTISSVPRRTFYNCSSLTAVNIPSSVTSVGERAFFGCSALETVALPSGVTTIEEGAFSGCKALVGIEIPSGVATIGEAAFSGCTALKEIVLPDGLLSLGAYAFGESTYSSYEFGGCTSLVSCYLPERLTALEDGTFSGCTSLTGIVLPDALASIGEECFARSGLESIIMNDALASIGASAFNECESLVSAVIGAGVVSVGSYAFANCTALTYAYTGDSLATLGDYMFQNDTALETVDFGMYLISIGRQTFDNCTALENVELGLGLISIGRQAFGTCTSIDSLVIPSTVTDVARDAFTSCTLTLYIENTADFVNAYWTTGSNAWNSGFDGATYYYSQFEPALNEDGTDYDGNFWYYNDKDEITVWTYSV